MSYEENLIMSEQMKELAKRNLRVYFQGALATVVDEFLDRAWAELDTEDGDVPSADRVFGAALAEHNAALERLVAMAEEADAKAGEWGDDAHITLLRRLGVGMLGAAAPLAGAGAYFSTLYVTLSVQCGYEPEEPTDEV